MIGFIASLPDPRTSFSVKLEVPQFRLKELPVIVRSQKREENKVKVRPYRTFQITPHLQVKNEKLDQFPDIIAETYKELLERFKGGSLEDPERIFFETVLTEKGFCTYITTNTHLVEEVKQQTQLIWKDITIKDVEERNYLDFESSKAECYDLKLKYPYFLSLRTDRRVTECPLPEILELSRFMAEGDKVIIQFGFQSAEADWYKEASDERDYFTSKKPKGWNKGDKLNDATEKKLSEYGFDFTLRIAVLSPEDRKRSRLSRGVILALKQLNLDNELIEKKIKPAKVNKWIKEVKACKISVPLIFGKRNIMTNSEIAHFLKLPQRTLQEQYPIIENVSKPELSLPDELFLDVPGIDIGDVIERGKKKRARIPVQAFKGRELKKVLDAYCLPEFVFGEQGSGKTGEAIHRAHSAIRIGQTTFFFDTADGAATKELHDSLPIDYPEEKIIHLDLTNKAWPIGLTWTYNPKPSDQDDDLQAEQARETGKMFLRQFVGGIASTDFTTRMDRYLSASSRAAGSSPLNIELALTSPSYRKELMELEHVKSQLDILMELEALQEKAKKGSEDISVDGILSRLRTLSSDRFRSNIFYQVPETTLNFRHYADNPEGGYGYCVTIFCDKNSYGPEGQEAIMTYLLAKVLLEGAYSRVDIPQAERKPFVLILDEPHRFIKGEMATKLGEDAAVELRKYRCKLVMMNHSREQLGKLWDSFESGGIQVTMYKSKNVNAFKDMAPIIAPLDPVDAWSALGEHEAVVTRKLPSKKEISFICKMAHPPAEVKDRSKRREECAHHFGRHWKEVSNEIQELRMEYMKKDQEWFAKVEMEKQREKELEKEARKAAREKAKAEDK